jgi:molybdate transport system substrate-binding protein
LISQTKAIRPALALAGLLLGVEPGVAADIEVFTSGAPSAVQKVVASRFEQATGHRVSITAQTLSVVRKSIAAATTPDVVVLPRPVMLGMEKAGQLRAGTLTDLARVGIGVVVREGAPRPDVSTVQALRQTLLAAKSIMHPDPQGGGFTGAHIDRMFEKLGIAGEVRPKVKLGFAFTGGVTNVAKGVVELGLFNISEIVPIEGVALAGPLPQELQNYLVFAGALHARGDVLEPGAAFLRALTGSEAEGAWKNGGFEMLGGK